MDQPQLVQFAHDRRDAPGIVQIDHEMLARRGKFAEIGALAADLVENFQAHVQARLAEHGGQMQHRIGGAAQGHVHGHGIGHGFGGDDVQRADIVLEQIHDPHARGFGQAHARRAHRRDGAVAGQGHADGFGQAVHGVGREHARAGPAAGTGPLGHALQLVLAQSAAAHPAHGLEDRDQVAARVRPEIAGQHGPAGNQHRGQVQAHHGHEHAGHAFVAVGDEDQGIKGVAPGHDFNGIRDEFARRQGKTHALVVHGDAVAHGNGRKLQGRAAGQAHTGLDGRGQGIQMHVAGHHLAGGVDHAHQGAFHFLPGQPQGVEQGTVRGFFQPALHLFAASIIHGGNPLR